MMSIKEHPPHHVPVLLDDVIDQLAPRVGESYLDLTAGYGGHARAILARTDNYLGATLVDRDENAIKTLEDLHERGVRLLHQDFLTAAEQLVADGQKFDIILADLGVSSPQLDREERGFSFQSDGPLDMRMDQRQERTAADIVNSSSLEELTKIITQYGEEPRAQARRIAQAIVEARPLHTTQELAETVKSVSRPGAKKHPATRTFQALRIEVNQELKLIAGLLPLLPRLLRPGGRVGAISFHSLEDRLVKQFFKEQVEAGFEAELIAVTKKPIDGAINDAHNPRSRSAKLRVAAKK